MENIFSFPKLVQHMRMEIPNNIKIGQMQNHILEQVPQCLMNRVIPQLKKEFLEEHKEILNTKEKIDHVQMVLDKILTQKYNFAKQNIDEGEKFNQYYKEDLVELIDLPKQQRPLQCQFCKDKFYKVNSHLKSHQRSCPNKKNDEKTDQIEEKKIKSEKPQGFMPVKIKGPKSTETKPARVFAAEVIKKNNDTKKEEEEKKEQIKGKRERPGSSCSLGLDIFFDE